MRQIFGSMWFRGGSQLPEARDEVGSRAGTALMIFCHVAMLMSNDLALHLQRMCRDMSVTLHVLWEVSWYTYHHMPMQKRKLTLSDWSVHAACAHMFSLFSHPGVRTCLHSPCLPSRQAKELQKELLMQRVKLHIATFLN